MSNPLRALVGARVSVVKGDEKVSHLAQQKSGQEWADEQGHLIVGTFQDLDVSADKYHTFRRPELGPWLTEERHHEWDIIVWSKIDRAFRSTWDCVQFSQWAKERKKIVVFAEDGLTLNFRNPQNTIESMMAELFVYLGSFFAQLELNRFKTRALDAHAVLRGTNRWASGTPPLGFRTVPNPSGPGVVLETDPDGKRLLHEIAGHLLNGWSFVKIATWLNETGALSARDRITVPKGGKRRDWSTNNVIRVLTSPATQGYKIRATGGPSDPGVPVLDNNGEPIRMGPPTFDLDTWEQIQEAVAKRRDSRQRRTHTSNPLLHVGFCGKCGKNLTQQFTKRTLKDGTEKVYRSYRCGRTPARCTNTSVRADDADELIEERFLELRGNRTVIEQKFVPGSDNREEIERARGALERLKAESDAGLVTDNTEYIGRVRAVSGRLTELEKEPYSPSRWEPVETERTYGDVWEEANHEERRKMLIDAGVRFVVHQGNPLRVDVQVP